MDRSMLVPVNDALKNELVATSDFLDGFGFGHEKKVRINDRAHYKEIVDQLEALVVSVLGATTSTPLTGPQPLGAGFWMDSGDKLNRSYMEVIGYLRDNASEVLNTQGMLSAYNAENSDVAMSFLQQLQGLLLQSIVNKAEEDLAALKRKGVVHLLCAADFLAKSARKNTPA